MKLKNAFYLGLLSWVLFPCAVFLLSAAGYELLIGTWWTVFRIQAILNAVAALSSLGLVYLRGHKRPLFAVIGIVLLLQCGNSACRFLDACQEYHSFSSPDGADTLVMMENVDPIAGQVRVYKRLNPFLLSPMGSIITDDGYRPICDGQYELSWQEDTVSLSVFNGAGEWKTIVMEREQ